MKRRRETCVQDETTGLPLTGCGKRSNADVGEGEGEGGGNSS